jgi:adenosylhomocysteine nucleosidase
MIIGVIGAMDEEVELILKKVDVQMTVDKAKMKFVFGEFLNKKVVIVRCGIGKVNAAICTQILIDDFHVDCVINVGTAGGIGIEIYPGDVVIADNLVEHDMDTSAFGDKVGQIPRMDTFDFKCSEQLVTIAKKAAEKLTDHNCFTGRIVTGDQFINSVEKIKWLYDEFGAIACEMEGASIAHVCYLNNIPFVVIRSISDNANNGSHIDFQKYVPIAVNNSTVILENMINLM